MNIQLIDIGAIVIAYLIGSISNSILIAKWFQLPDPRKLGSGNPGATNMLRTGNKKAAALTLIGDLLKGLLPIIIARWFHLSLDTLCIMGLAAIIGHMYPIYYKFRGGKGVATTLGVLIGVNWPLAIIWIIAWLATAIITRYSSLAALIATIILPFAAYYMELALSIIFLLFSIIVLIVWRHRPNIKKLIQGQENKIGTKH